jgi:dihydroxyacetone kinase
VINHLSPQSALSQTARLLAYTDAAAVSAEAIKSAMKTASEDVIDLEPELTRWDTIVGDGDCGETCANGAKAVLGALKEGLGADGDLVDLFRELSEIIDGECGAN